MVLQYSPKSLSQLCRRIKKRRRERTKTQTKFVVILSIHLIIYFTFLPLHTVSFLLRPHWFIYLDAHVCRSPVVKKTTTRDRWCVLTRNRPKSIVYKFTHGSWQTVQMKCKSTLTTMFSHLDTCECDAFVRLRVYGNARRADTKYVSADYYIHLFIYNFFFLDWFSMRQQRRWWWPPPLPPSRSFVIPIYVNIVFVVRRFSFFVRFIFIFHQWFNVQSTYLWICGQCAW